MKSEHRERVQAYNGSMMGYLSELKIRFVDCARRHELLPEGTLVLAAVSGGADSSAMLHILSSVRSELSIKVVVGHLNHCMRGAESDGDAEYVRQLCSELDIECRIGCADVYARKRRQGGSLQEAARAERFHFLHRTANELGATRIALAHNRQDQVETILLHILRGSGLEGVQGLSASALPLIRPMLDFSRAESEAYCRAAALSFRTDSSNHKLNYLRNRLRSELLPELKAYYNPGVETSLIRLGDVCREENHLLNELADQALTTAILAREHDSILLNADAVRLLPKALARRVVRGAVLKVRGTLIDISFEQIEKTLQAIERSADFQISLPVTEIGPIQVELKEDLLRVYRKDFTYEPVLWQKELQLPGETYLPDYTCIETRILENEASSTALMDIPQDVLILPIQELKLPLYARIWRKGDRIRPRGMVGTQKLQDLFTNRHIAGVDRLRFHVITDSAQQVLAIPGLRASDICLTRELLLQQDCSKSRFIALWERKSSVEQIEQADLPGRA